MEEGVAGWIAESLKYGPLGAVLVASYFRLWMWRTDHVEALAAQTALYERILDLQTKRINDLAPDRDPLRAKRT